MHHQALGSKETKEETLMSLLLTVQGWAGGAGGGEETWDGQSSGLRDRVVDRRMVVSPGLPPGPRWVDGILESI